MPKESGEAGAPDLRVGAGTAIMEIVEMKIEEGRKSFIDIQSLALPTEYCSLLLQGS